MSALTINQASLERATAIRQVRADMKRHIHALPRTEGRLMVAALLLTTPEWLQSARIGQVLCWPWRTYQTELDAWLGLAGADPLARVAGPYQRHYTSQDPKVLTERQRHVLADCLRGSC